MAALKSETLYAIKQIQPDAIAFLAMLLHVRPLTLEEHRRIRTALSFRYDYKGLHYRQI